MLAGFTGGLSIELSGANALYFLDATGCCFLAKLKLIPCVASISPVVAGGDEPRTFSIILAFDGSSIWLFQDEAESVVHCLLSIYNTGLRSLLQILGIRPSRSGTCPRGDNRGADEGEILKVGYARGSTPGLKPKREYIEMERKRSWPLRPSVDLERRREAAGGFVLLTRERLRPPSSQSRRSRPGIRRLRQREEPDKCNCEEFRGGPADQGATQ